MSAHTPGPWAIQPNTFGDGVWIEGNGHLICKMESNSSPGGMARVRSGERDANARLIASAPALVSALEELLAADAVQMPFAEEGIEAQDAWANRRAAAREAARHALRLARGEE